MNHLETSLPVIYLKPAEMHLADRPSIVSTVLGSCVSITMFNHRLQVGAICHGLLPQCRRKNDCQGGCGAIFKYVDCSIRQMLGQFRSLGIGHQEIEVKLFGGADMFTPGTGKRVTVGTQNIRVALSIIKKERLNLCKTDVGGMQGRKIFFYAHTGEIFLKRLGKRDPELTDQLIKAEKEIRIRRSRKRSPDQVGAL